MLNQKVVTGIVVNEAGQVLLAKRRKRSANDDHGGLWEFPGGKVEPGETKMMALKRELNEELSITIDTTSVLFVGRHEHVHVIAAGNVHVNDLHLYEVRKFTGEPKPNVTDELRWVTLDEAKKYKGMPSHFDILRLYKRMLPR